MSKAVPRTPLSQLHGNGKAFPWSSMDVHMHRKCRPQHPPPSWMTASSPPGQTAHPTPVLLSLCLHFSIRITPVPTRLMPQLCGLGQDCQSRQKWEEPRASVDARRNRLIPDLFNEESITEPSWKKKELKSKSEFFFPAEPRSNTAAQAVIKLLILLHQSCSCIMLIGIYPPHPTNIRILLQHVQC